mmetsp:Transcript_30545/g.45517  ORF Transcript_30545/g.45517 Transcript_30545/m.45517 type:complete len:603 (+) Transcript_30545:1808-3616(+)
MRMEMTKKRKRTKKEDEDEELYDDDIPEMDNSHLDGLDEETLEKLSTYRQMFSHIVPIRKNSGGVIQPFPEKLMKVLDRSELSDIIRWMPHNRAFIVSKPKIFVADVLPKYFKQSKFMSFTRQLNLWGFKRITKGRDAGAYYHELFLRGRLRLSARMRRQKIKGTGKKLFPNPKDEPDFYEMDRKKPLRNILPAPPPDRFQRNNMLIQHGSGVGNNAIPMGGFDISRLSYFPPSSTTSFSRAASGVAAATANNSLGFGYGQQSPSMLGANSLSQQDNVQLFTQEQAQQHMQGAQQVLESQSSNNGQASNLILQQVQHLQRQQPQQQQELLLGTLQQQQQQQQAILNSQGLLQQTNNLLPGNGSNDSHSQQDGAGDEASVENLRRRLIAAAEALGKTSQQQSPTFQQKQQHQQYQQLGSQPGSLGTQLGMSSSKKTLPSNHSLFAALGGNGPANQGLDVSALVGGSVTPGTDLSALNSSGGSSGNGAAPTEGLDMSKMLSLVTGAGTPKADDGVGHLLNVVTALQKALQAQQEAQQQQQQAVAMVGLLQQYTAAAVQGAAPGASSFGLQSSTTGTASTGGSTSAMLSARETLGSQQDGYHFPE